MPRIEIEGGPTFDCASDDTVMRAGLRAGLGMPYACNVGSCGNCRFELKAGTVTHLREDPPAWSERDRKRGRWLGCQARPGGDLLIKVRLDPDCVPAHLPLRRPARLTAIEDITHDIREFHFAIDGDDGFLPGQYALIEPPGVTGARAYSMSNLPGAQIWSFQIKRVPDGAATGALFETVKVGDTVTLDGPYGTAYLRETSPRDIVLIAGGSGLSPMISIARGALTSDALAGRRIDFFYGGRAPRDICGEAILEALPGWVERGIYSAVCSEVSEDWSGATGFVHEVVEKTLGAELTEREIYFAGPPAMATAMQKMLHAAGVSPEQTHFDEFY